MCATLRKGRRRRQLKEIKTRGQLGRRNTQHTKKEESANNLGKIYNEQELEIFSTDLICIENFDILFLMHFFINFDFFNITLKHMCLDYWVFWHPLRR